MRTLCTTPLLTRMQRHTWGDITHAPMVTMKQTKLSDDHISSIRLGDIERVRANLTKVDVNATDDYNNTALHFAVYHHQANIAKLLVQEGADIHALNMYLNTPLYVAAIRNAVDIARCLIREGALKKNAQHHRLSRTPLHHAATHGHLPMVRLLLDAGANIDALDIHGSSALHCALDNDKVDVAEYLIARGANPHTQDEFGISVIQKAFRWGYRKLIAYVSQVRDQ